MNIDHAEPIVERTDMLATIIKQFTDRRTQRLINLWGISGIGKSYILRQCAEELSRNASVYLLQLDDRAPQLTLPEAVTHSGWEPIVSALQTLPELERLAAPNVPAESAVPRLYCIPRTTSSRIVLLIDDTGDFPDWRWLQRALIKSIADNPEHFVVAVSHITLFWDLSELRQIAFPIEAERFARKEIEDFLKQSGLPFLGHLATNIDNYTNGYPLAVKFFVNQLQSQTSDERPINFNDFTDEISAQLTDGYLGIVRLVEVDVLLAAQEMVAIEFTEEMRRSAREALLITSADLEDRTPPLITKPISGFRPRVAQQLREAVRRMLTRDTYLERCHILEQIYFARTEEHPKTRAYAFLEWLFFAVELLQNHYAGYTLGQWQERFQMLLRRLGDASAQDVALGGTSLYVLFCRDIELITALQLVKSASVGDVSIPDANLNNKSTLYDYVDAGLNDLFADVEIEMRFHPLRTDYNQLSREIFSGFYERLDAYKKLPTALREQTDFLTTIQKLIAMLNSNDISFDTLRQRINQSYNSDRGLPPKDVNQFVTFLGSHGIVDYRSDQRTYSFNPLLRNLAQQAKAPVRQKDLISTGSNSVS